MEITTGNNDRFVTETEPIVQYTNFIEFVKNGKVVGKVDATFDLREMPEEHHGMAVQLIMSKAFTMSLPSYKAPPVKEQMEKKEVEKKRWFGLF